MGWENRVECGILEVMSVDATGDLPSLGEFVSSNYTVAFDGFANAYNFGPETRSLATELVGERSVENIQVQAGGAFERLVVRGRPSSEGLAPNLQEIISDNHQLNRVENNPIVVRHATGDPKSEVVAMGIRFRTPVPPAPAVRTVWLVVRPDLITFDEGKWPETFQPLGGGIFSKEYYVSYNGSESVGELLQQALTGMNRALEKRPLSYEPGFDAFPVAMPNPNAQPYVPSSEHPLEIAMDARIKPKNVPPVSSTKGGLLGWRNRLKGPRDSS